MRKKKKLFSRILVNLLPKIAFMKSLLSLTASTALSSILALALSNMTRSRLEGHQVLKLEWSISYLNSGSCLLSYITNSAS